MRKIRILTEALGEMMAEVFEDKNPRTVEKIWTGLPLESTVNRWGDEIYFSTPLQIDLEDSQEVVEEGELAFWPPGKAICIFFGPTPVSRSGEPRAYSPVNVFGRVLGNASEFKKTKSGDKIRLERV